MSSKQPNILVIQADQLSALALPAYGNRFAKTPHLNKLAEDGVVFENSYCNFPLCAPSRFSMMTGMLASRIEAFDNGAELPAGMPTIAHYLRKAGYDTCLSGKMHFVGPDMLHGFEERLTAELYPTDFLWTANWENDTPDFASSARCVTEAGICVRSQQLDHDDSVGFNAERKLHDYARAGNEQPFFLLASFTHPHDPYFCTREYWERYTDAEIEMPAVPLLPPEQRDPHSQRILEQHGLVQTTLTEAEILRARHAYFSNVSYIDDQVGRLLEALRVTGMDENTVVVFTSDHGDMLGERGLWLKKVFFEQAARVPLIINWPDNLQPHRADQPVSLVDMAATLLDIGNAADTVEPLDGVSLLPTAQGGSGGPGGVHIELTSEGVPAPKFMIRRDHYKYISGGGDPAQLFDLRNDPHELDNIAGTAGISDIETAFVDEVENRWDAEAMSERIRLSQRRRLLVQDAHRNGQSPVWDYNALDSATAACYRGGTSYEEWALKDITSVEP